MSDEAITQTQLANHDEKITQVSSELNQLKITVTILAEKQLVLIEKIDSFIEKMSQVDKRLQRLEEFMLTHLERTAFIKAIFKFWPVIAATLFFCFSVGIMVDDQKVANEIANKVELKAP